jgi:hypothetical protein
MSVQPKTLCLSKRRKYPSDIFGTSSIYYGHKLRERETRYATKYDPRAIEDSVWLTKDKKEYEQLFKLYEFVTESDRKIKNKHLRQQVQESNKDHLTFILHFSSFTF